MNIKKSIYTFIITVLIVFFNLLILIFPELTIKSASTGLLLWYNSALPSLLPFIISINLLKHTSAPIIISKLLEPISKRLFKITGIGVFPIVMGMLSGYPLGAKLCCELYCEKKISKTQAQHILCFSNNSGPLFIIGTVGTLFLKNTSAGYFIMTMHYLSAIITGIIISIGKKPEHSPMHMISHTYSIGKILSDTLENSINTIVMIGGYIILFSIITGYISPFIKSQLLCGIICGIFEITKGCSIIADNNLCIVTALISWGGLSIHFQTLSFITKTDLAAHKYILAKILQVLITICLYIIIYPIYTQKLS